MHFVNRQPQVEILRDSKSSDLSPLITERKEEVYSHSKNFQNKSNTEALNTLLIEVRYFHPEYRVENYEKARHQN